VTRIRLFVYGSLRRGAENHQALRRASFLREVTTEPAYDVIRLGAYPALVSGSMSVAGELYEVEPGDLPALDAFEGPGYRRAHVRLSDGGDAEAYFLAEAARR
jgi:gamma-glutamylcyclotransferase (GGCT)/AIG2-like uncharacterized protein YtfP